MTHETTASAVDGNFIIYGFLISGSGAYRSRIMKKTEMCGVAQPFDLDWHQSRCEFLLYETALERGTKGGHTYASSIVPIVIFKDKD